jgi:hypothetical protein
MTTATATIQGLIALAWARTGASAVVVMIARANIGFWILD